MRVAVLAELDDLLRLGDEVLRAYNVSTGSGLITRLGQDVVMGFMMKAEAAIVRIAGTDCTYVRRIPNWHEEPRITALIGLPSLMFAALQALRADVERGRLIGLEQRVRAAVSDDYLEQAAELLEETWHVAAMVLVGTVLEAHLRRLCELRPALRPKTEEKGRSLNLYNEALWKADVYDQPTWRRIQSVTDRRNKAAHGEPDAVLQVDVEEDLAYVRRLLENYPA